MSHTRPLVEGIVGLPAGGRASALTAGAEGDLRIGHQSCASAINDVT
jgi:hypothetical protein